MTEKLHDAESGAPLVDRDYVLDKSPGMAGWTFTIIPEIAPDPHAPFGWVRVRGSIDGVPISNYHLLPTLHGTNRLFLSVNAAMRRKLGKGEGDTVHITLWRDDTPPTVPAELRACIDDDPAARRFFDSLTTAGQQQWVRWVYGAKTERVRVERMARTVAALADRLHFADRGGRKE
jgi:hypothetical protein